MPRFSHFLGIFALLFVVASCDNLPDEIVAEAAASRASLDAALASDATRSSEYDAMLSGKDGEFLTVYAKQEDWGAEMRDASAELAAADALYKIKIAPSLDRNDPDEGPAIKGNISAIAIHIADFEKHIVRPFDRALILIDARDHLEERFASADDQIAKVRKSIEELNRYAIAVAADFPLKKDILSRDFSGPLSLSQKAEAVFSDVIREYRRRDRNEVDYAVFADSASLLVDAVAAYHASAENFRKKAASLYLDYTRTLTGMQVDDADANHITYRHRYLTTVNAKRKEAWVVVDRATHEREASALGMDVEAKPFGMFDDQTYREFMPHGMAFAGDARYGQWKSSHGRVTWFWNDGFSEYGLLYGTQSAPFLFTREEVAAWAMNFRGFRPYYGEDRTGKPLYGTDGTVTARVHHFFEP